MANKDFSETLSLVLRLWACLPRHRKQQSFYLLSFMSIGAFAEVFSIATVIPFLSILANPSQAFSNPVYKPLIQIFHIQSDQDFLLPISLLFCFSAFVVGLIRTLSSFFNVRLSSAIGSDISTESYRRTLYQPYLYHISRNSSLLLATITTDVNQVIYGAINPVITTLSSLVVSLAIIIALVYINPFVALSMGATIITVYLLLSVSTRGPINHLSKEQASLNRKLIHSLQEGLGGIREIIIDSSQDYYFHDYVQSDRPLRRSQGNGLFLSVLPRLVMEPIGIISIALVGYSIAQYDSLSNALPTLGALVLGSQRLLPIVQKIYEGWALTKNASQSLINVLHLLELPAFQPNHAQVSKSISITNSINLHDVSFVYPMQTKPVIKNISLQISKGERVALTGKTGCGKTTIVNLIMGLFPPSSGSILLDGRNLWDTDRIIRWRRSVAHVPQNIYLADCTIAENIAFGIPKSNIDYDRLVTSASKSQILNYILTLPDQFDTVVGERGVRLSGGQRQRIGIARALYKKSTILVLDEATSALDLATETTLMDSIYGLDRDLTIIMIAHRLSTVELCDRIINVDDLSSFPPLDS